MGSQSHGETLYKPISGSRVDFRSEPERPLWGATEPLRAFLVFSAIEPAPGEAWQVRELSVPLGPPPRRSADPRAGKPWGRAALAASFG